VYLLHAKQGTGSVHRRFEVLLGSTATKQRPIGEIEMKLFKLVKNFRNDESGAVTVDWVVLTAAIVGLGIAVLSSVSSGTTTLAGTISSELGDMTIASY